MINQTIYIIVLFFTLPFFANAAELYFETVPTSVKVGDTVTATLFLDPEGETINAIEGSVSYSPELSVAQIRNGESLITFWMQSPHVKGDTISYAGIVPGGYQGDAGSGWKGFRPGKVFTIVFRAEKEGEAWIQVNRETVVLLHDGKGTEAQLMLKDTKLFIKGNGEVGEKPLEPINMSWDDTIAPEPFTPVVIVDQRALPDVYYLIFEATDKQSGIDHYEVQEGRENPFVRAESPYLLKYQYRNVTINVNAFDKAGNVRSETITPDMYRTWYERFSSRLTLLGMVLFSIGIMVVWRARKKK